MKPHDISWVSLALTAGLTVVLRSVIRIDGPAVAVAVRVGVMRYVPPKRSV